MNTRPWAGTGGPLAVRNFRLLSAGQFASTVGDYCYVIALPWLVLSDHGSTVTLGIILACYGVPRTVLIPAGGVLADKLSPRLVMLAADAARFLLVSLLAILAASHTSTLIALIPIAALLGAGEGLFLPASFSIMPTLLPGEQLASGNAILAALVQIGSLTGPALGGILVATAGPAPAFAVDALSFAISAAALALIRGHALSAADGGQEDRPQETVRHFLRHSRVLLIIIAMCVIANFTGGGTFGVAFPALAYARYGASGYGWIEACFGAGALAGTIAAARVNSIKKPALTAYGAYLIEAVAIGAVPFLGGLPGAAAAMTVAGLSNSYGNIVFTTLVQRWAPPRLLGRVMSLLMLASFGTYPVSVAVAGVLVRHLHPPPFFPVAGAVLALSMLLPLTQSAMRGFGAAQVRDQAAVDAR